MRRIETISYATARTAGQPQLPLEIRGRHFCPRRPEGAHAAAAGNGTGTSGNAGGRAPEALTTTNRGGGTMERQRAVASATDRQAGATRTLEVNGTSLAYMEQGQGYPVVLIHSSGVSHRQ